MMRPTERHRKFIADLLPGPAWLGEAQVTRVAGLPAADEAGLPGYKAKVLPSTQPLGLRLRHLGPAVHSHLAIGLVVRLLPHTKLASLPRFAAVQRLERKQGLTCLAPKRGFVAA